MNQTFGEFIEEFPPDYDSLELTFTSSARSIKRHWRNNRLSAYFVADYFSTFLPIDEDKLQDDNRIKASKSAVSYVGNELLENAIKFNEKNKCDQVNFGIYFLEDIAQIRAVIFTKNSITAQRVDKFQALIKKLLSTAPDELYVQQVEKTAESEHSEASGLGLLTIINDYSAKLGWKFESEPSQPQIVTVTTMAQIVV